MRTRTITVNAIPFAFQNEGAASDEGERWARSPVRAVKSSLDASPFIAKRKDQKANQAKAEMQTMHALGMEMREDMRRRGLGPLRR